MVKNKLKEIEKKLKKIERKVGGAIPLPEELGKALKEGTTEIIQILDQTLEKNIPAYLKKKTKTPGTLKMRERTKKINKN